MTPSFGSRILARIHQRRDYFSSQRLPEELGFAEGLSL
jgi:hypothetical protein